jgi:hypothetical protein
VRLIHWESAVFRKKQKNYATPRSAFQWDIFLFSVIIIDVGNLSVTENYGIQPSLLIIKVFSS